MQADEANFLHATDVARCHLCGKDHDLRDPCRPAGLRPTSELRFVSRIVPVPPLLGQDFDHLHHGWVLQQKWNETGAVWIGPNEPPFEWRYVPMIEEPTGITGEDEGPAS